MFGWVPTVLAQKMHLIRYAIASATAIALATALLAAPAPAALPLLRAARFRVRRRVSAAGRSE